MPKSKNQIVRFIIINDCLRKKGKKFWSKQQLIDEINKRADIVIRERTLDKDIEEMRYSTQLNYFAPIEYSKRHEGYFYSDENYSIDKLPFNERDLEILAFATSILNQYKSISILQEFSGVIAKFMTLINHVKNTSNEAIFTFIDFEKSPKTQGVEHLDVIIEAIKSKKAIEITYQKFINEEIKTHIVSPYLLKEYRNRWFLLGFLHKKDKIITFGLERIQSINILPSSVGFHVGELDTTLFFKNTIGVSFNDVSPVEVVLSFSPLQGKYIKTQPIHETQEVLIDNQLECRIKLTVVINYELVSLILGFGKEVRVLAPEELKLTIKDSIIHMYTMYEE